VSVSGTVPAYANLATTVFGAGDATTAPTATSNVAGGYTFAFTTGAELNGYKIKIGNMAPGTPTTAQVDKDSKTITINGDFASGAVTAATIQTEVNNALNGKGFTQTATVGGTFNAIAGTDVASGITNGGTSVESIAEDGTINFVDGAKAVRSYDGTLKSLKIPESVKIPGTGKELKVTSYTIDKTGIINAVLENGSVAAVGQIAISSFNNPEGLTKLGKDLYSDSANSGTATIRTGVGTTGDDNSQGYGDLAQGMLEMSNVDLAEQFTDMIVANRAFQASSKMITTGDDILQDIINLKR
jgi:flagellar hook-basal body protein